MHRKLSVLAGSLLIGLSLACGGEDAAQQEQEEARAARWADLQVEQAGLSEKREQADEIAARIQAVEEGEAEAEGDPEALRAEAQKLEQELTDAAQTFYEALVEFINSAEVAVGEEMPERVKEAIRLKSHEDAIVAREYIDKGGDYARALEIYDTALQVDPANSELQEARAWAEENRWMTEERFGQAKKGMNRRQVRELLGQPNLHNIRDYPEKQRLAWFYPKGPDRSAAGVYFQKKGDQYTVYQLDFSAVKPAAAAAAGEEASGP